MTERELTTTVDAAAPVGSEQPLDDLDVFVSSLYETYVVQKNLAGRFKKQYPVPTYVGEFLLEKFASAPTPRRCEGLKIVKKQLRDRTVRAGTQELFKSRALE